MHIITYYKDLHCLPLNFSDLNLNKDAIFSRSGSSEQHGTSGNCESHIDSIEKSNNAAHHSITGLAGQGQYQDQGQKVKTATNPAVQDSHNDNGRTCSSPQIRNQRTRTNPGRKKPCHSVHFDSRNGCVTLPSIMLNRSPGGAKRMIPGYSNKGYDDVRYSTVTSSIGPNTDTHTRLASTPNGLILGTKMLRASQGCTMGSGPIRSDSDSTKEYIQEPIYASLDPGDTINRNPWSRSNVGTQYGNQQGSASPHVTRIISNEEVVSDCSGSLPGSVNSHIDEDEELGQSQEYQVVKEVTEDELVRCCHQAKAMTRNSERLYCKSLPSPIVLPESPGNP